jgi:hypothetical protein
MTDRIKNIKKLANKLSVEFGYEANTPNPDTQAKLDEIFKWLGTMACPQEAAMWLVQRICHRVATTCELLPDEEKVVEASLSQDFHS